MTDTDYVKQRLESAGKTLTMLTAAGIYPKGYFSSMPEYVRELNDLLEYDPDGRTYTIRTDRSREMTRKPTPQEITEYEEVEGWLTSLTLYCHGHGFPWVSKAVQYGLPRCPRSGRVKKSLRSVAKIFANKQGLRKSVAETG